jgi:predicted alpha/beta hydrolase
MKVEDIRVPSSDGYSLAGTLYEPASPAARHVLIAAATGVRRRFYDRFARFLCARGFGVVSFDYRGIGDSRPGSLVGFQASMRDWGEKDLAAAIDWTVARSGKLLAVGHSAGGQLFGLAANNCKVRALVAVAAQSGYWGFWPSPRKYLMAALWYAFVPGLTRACGYFPSRLLRLGEDLPAGVAREWASWCRNRAYMVDAQRRPDLQFFEAFQSPIRYYSFEDDRYAPQAAVDYLAGCYANAPKEARHVCPADIGALAIGHFGFFREKCKRRLWTETAEWFESR